MSFELLISLQFLMMATRINMKGASIWCG